MRYEILNISVEYTAILRKATSFPGLFSNYYQEKSPGNEVVEKGCPATTPKAIMGNGSPLLVWSKVPWFEVKFTGCVLVRWVMKPCIEILQGKLSDGRAKTVWWNQNGSVDIHSSFAYWWKRNLQGFFYFTTGAPGTKRCINSLSCFGKFKLVVATVHVLKVIL